MALTKVTGHVIKSDTNITSHNINSSGIVTAITFDGNFTGVAVTFTGDSTIGSLGITTNLNVGGISTFTGNIDANGDIDVDGQTNLDHVSIAGVTTTTDHIYIDADNKKLNIGDSSDLQLYHTGSRSEIINNTGDLIIQPGASSNLFLRSQTGAAHFKGAHAAQVELYFNGNKKFETTNTGAVVSGILTVTGNMNVEGVLTYQDVTNIDSIGIITARAGIVAQDDVTFTGASGNILFDKSQDRLEFDNNIAAAFGDGRNLRIFANDSNGQINNYTGDLYIQNDSSSTNEKIYIRAKGAEDSITATANGVVQLYYDGTIKFNTASTGVTVHGTTDPNLTIRQGGSSSSGSGFLAYENVDGNGTPRSIAKIQGKTSGNGGYGELNFQTAFNNSLSTRWTIDQSGHLVPGAVGSYNIGSATAEIGDVYLADNKKVFLGSDQDLEIFHDGSHSRIKDVGTGILSLSASQLNIQNAAVGENMAEFFENGAVNLYYDQSAHATAKLATTATGVSIHGEVAASQDYPLVKPILNWNFAATKTLDPRIQFRRTGTGTFIDEKGIVQYAGSNKPRFDHHPTTGASLGLLLEKSSTNYQPYSVDMSQGANNNEVTVENNAAIAPDGTMSASKITGGTNQSTSQRLGWNTASVASGSYTNWSIWLKSEETSCLIQIYSNTYTIGAGHITIELADGTTTGSSAPSSVIRYNVEKYPNKWWRVSWSGNGTASSGGMYVSVVPTTGSARAANTGAAHSKVWYAWGLQEEISTDRKFTTSYIPTYGVSAARGHDNAEVLGDDFDDFFDLYQGTVVHEFSNAFQTWTYGGSGWEFNNDNYQYNVITQISSGYAHNSYPGAYAVANGENSDSGTNSSSLFGSSSSPGNASTNGGYDAGRVPNSTQVDNTRYYKTYTDAFSWDVSGSTNHLRVSSGGFGATNTNTNNISFRNISKLVFGNEASDMDGSYQKFNGRIKNWMYYDKALPASQLNTMTAQHPQTYL